MRALPIFYILLSFLYFRADKFPLLRFLQEGVRVVFLSLLHLVSGFRPTTELQRIELINRYFAIYI